MFAEVGLLGEVFFLFLLTAEEEVLVALVDGGGSGFEAVPNFFALLFGYGAGFAKFLMKLLQCVESGDHIFVFGELFGRFAKARFDFEVLFEIVGAHFVVDAQEIIELLDVVVKVFPRFGDLLGGDVANFLPFGLQGLEAIVLLVDVFGLRHHLFDFLDDIELALQVGLAGCFGFCRDFGAHFFDGSHETLIFLFVGIGSGHEIFGIAAFGYKGFAGFEDFVVVQTIEDVAQAVENGTIGRCGLLHIPAKLGKNFGFGGGCGDLVGRFGRCVFCFGGFDGDVGGRRGIFRNRGLRSRGVTFEGLCSYFELGGVEFTHESVRVRS